MFKVLIISLFLFFFSLPLWFCVWLCCVESGSGTKTMKDDQIARATRLSLSSKVELVYLL